MTTSKQQSAPALLKHLLVTGGLSVVIYGVLFWVLGLTGAAIVEGVYGAIVIISYFFVPPPRHRRPFVRFHIIAVFFVVFSVTGLLGGLQSSGGFIFWGLIGPLAAMVFLGYREATYTMLAFGGLVLASVLVSFPMKITTPLPVAYVDWFTGANVLGSSLLVISTLGYFLRRLQDEQEASEASARLMLRAQKLESLGTLAGGIAHDFNNILMAFMGNLSLIQNSLEKDDTSGELLEYLEDAQNALFQAKSLTAQMLMFSKGGAPVCAPLRVGPVLREAAEFVMHGKNCQCRFDIAADLFGVEADEGQLGQLVQNLVLNAVEAMPDGGEVRVSIFNVTAGGPLGLVEKQDYIGLRVADQGVGIEEGDMEKIFDPYFTTRPGGSGLGLTSCFTIVQNHGGEIDVTSSPGRGSVFTVYLPASSEILVPSRAPKPLVSRGQGRVLIMDDKAAIRDVLSKMIGALGYDVTATTEGSEAIRAYAEARQNEQPFHAVILDLTVDSGMGGAEAAKKIIEHDPSAYLIASSGYTNDRVMADHDAYGFSDVLLKPYTIDTLGLAISKNRRD